MKLRRNNTHITLLFILVIFLIGGGSLSLREAQRLASLLPSPTPSAQPTSTASPVLGSATDATLYAVSRVIDGDTIEVTKEGVIEKVRLIGIDTPEVVDPRKPVECFGKEASQKAKELLTGKQVILIADRSQQNKDRYGRLLRYVFLEDGTHINKQLISEGYASEYTYSTPYQYQAEFRQAQQEAQAAQRGLWAGDACLTQ
jgi:micrococcal nuclease